MRLFGRCMPLRCFRLYLRLACAFLVVAFFVLVLLTVDVLFLIEAFPCAFECCPIVCLRVLLVLSFVVFLRSVVLVLSLEGFCVCCGFAY